MIRMNNNQKPILKAIGVTKKFPGVLALENASISIQPREIHGLVGENGAGKSTLMKIIAGVYEMDEGQIFFKDQSVNWTSPASARFSGISMVFQDTQLVPDLNVSQNIWLGHELRKYGLISSRSLYQSTEELIEQFGISIDPKAYVSNLSMPQKQIVEILKALVMDSDLLILDEPTSSLTPQEVRQLFRVVRDIRKNGKSVVFISHRIPEVIEISDTITIMKDGNVVKTISKEDANQELLVNLMVGREIDILFPEKAKYSEIAERETLFSVESLSSNKFKDISFEIKHGEVIGLAGIEGNGQREICRALFGKEKIFNGNIYLHKKQLKIKKPSDAINAGIAYISSDRYSESIFENLNIRKNASVPNLDHFSYFKFFVNKGKEKQAIEELVIKNLNVRTPSTEEIIGNLSGGNQQKVVVGRWLMSQPSVYIFDEPTKGIDVASKIEMYRLIRRLANQNKAVIILSTDMLELIGVTDRILVISKGQITEDLDSVHATEEKILGAAVCSDEGEFKCDPEDEIIVKNVPNKLKWFNRHAFFHNWLGPTTLVFFIILLVSITSSKSPYFWGMANLGSLASQIVPLSLVSLGEFAVILLGGIDLSVGPIMGLTTAIASHIITEESGIPIYLGVIICLSAGASVGLFNAFLIKYIKIPDLIATLASYSIVSGLTLIIRPSPGGLIDVKFLDIMEITYLNIPVSFFCILIIICLGETIMQKTPIGLNLYATGSSKEAAFYTGIATSKYRVYAYIFCGIMASVAGLFLASRIGSGDPKAGIPFTILAITAVILGGTSIFGGKGTFTGVFLGSLFLIILQNFLNLLRASAYLQYLVTGIVILLAVGLYSMDWSFLRYYRLKNR